MGRDNRIDNLRAIAIFLVVLGHSIIIYDPSWGQISTSVECLPFFYLKKIINLIQMPLFFSISGFCFRLSRNQSFSIELFANKTKRILIPYFVVCILYMDPIKILLDVPGYTFSLDLFYKQILLLSNNGHLWYLPTLFYMIVAFSLIKKYTRKETRLWMVFIMSGFLGLLSFKITSFFSLSLFCDYFVYFILGYQICRYKSMLFDINNGWGYFMILLPILYVVLFQHSGKICNGVILLLAICAVLGCYIIVSPKENAILRELSKNSYGIYLFHSPLIYFMYMMCPNVNPLLMFAVNFFLCGMLCLGIIYLVRMCHLESLIGE